LRAKLSSEAATASQAGLAPTWPGSPAAEPSERSPEEASSMLSALQDGWERARIEDLDYFDDEEKR